MVNEEIISAIESLVAPFLQASPEDFLVSIRIKPTNNIKVFIDSDSGISIEKCIKYNRSLYAKIEEVGLFPDGNFSLEVSSPGVDEPLKLHRQYRKNIGRVIRVTFNDATEKEGKLLAVTDADILIEEKTGKGKRAEVKQYLVPFENIKSAIVQVQF